MLKVLTASALLGYLLLVWLNTNAFFEYLHLFKLAEYGKLKEYSALKKEGYPGTFLDFLKEYYYDHFFVRLGACPVCLSFWLGLSAYFWLGSFESIASPALILFFYLLFNKML